MAKRQREDLESSPTDSPSPGDSHNIDSQVTPQSDPLAETSSAKIIHLDSSSGEAPPAVIAMQCSLPPHAHLSFATYEDYEIHYAKFHVNRCLECRKNFPTEHFLNIHILENHDSLVAIKKERGDKIYGCFVEDCDKLCSTPQKRRMHLIDKHFFPKDYDFYVVNDGIDRRSSMLKSGRHRRRSSAAQHTMDIRRRSQQKQNDTLKESRGRDGGNEAESPVGDVVVTPSSSQEDQDEDMDGLAGAMSALKFVPTSVRFGRGKGRGRGGFSRT